MIIFFFIPEVKLLKEVDVFFNRPTAHMPSTLYYQSFMSKHLGGVIHLLDSDDQNCSENESPVPAPSYYPVTTFRPNIQGYVGGTPRKRKTPQVCTTGKKNIRGLHIFQQEMIPNIMYIFISLLLKKN